MLKLDEEELQEIKDSKRLFDIWINHVYRYKQLKELKFSKQKQPEEYDINATLDSLPFDDKCKFMEHILTTFKKFFLEDKYAGQKPNEMFLEIWNEANKDLTLQEIFDASIWIIRGAKKAKNNNDSHKYSFFKKFSENAVFFKGSLKVDNE